MEGNTVHVAVLCRGVADDSPDAGLLEVEIPAGGQMEFSHVARVIARRLR